MNRRNIHKYIVDMTTEYKPGQVRRKAECLGKGFPGDEIGSEKRVEVGNKPLFEQVFSNWGP